MLSYIYKKLVIDFPKITILFIINYNLFFYQAKNFNLDASSDALAIRGRSRS